MSIVTGRMATLTDSPTIAIDYTPAYEQGAGIGRLVRELIASLADIDDKTAYKLFVSGASSSDLPAPPGSNFSWYPTRLSPPWLARIWHRARMPLPVELWTGEVDLFHATDFVLPPTLSSTKTVVTVHDLSFVRVPDAASPRLYAYLSNVRRPTGSSSIYTNEISHRFHATKVSGRSLTDDKRSCR